MMKRTRLVMVVGTVFLWAWGVGGIEVGPFGPEGQGGAKNGQAFTIGTGGSVYELDGFVSVGGYDLNGALLGTTAQLSRDSLPTNLVYQFSSELSPDAADLVLTYRFSNTGSGAFSDVKFFVLLDAEIDQASNTFFNEYGTVQGSPGPGGGDPAPDQWQIDEPGFQTGTLFRNLFLGSLDNSNSVPLSALNDVAMGLGFSLGTLQPGDSASVRVMISQAQHMLGSFALMQHDADPSSTTVITLSGQIGPGSVAQLVGTVFKDANSNGVADGGEGMAGVQLTLLSNAVSVAQATTDSGGKYAINARPGNYQVAVVGSTLPGGLMLVPVVGGATNTPWPVSLASDFPVTVNWGYRPLPVGAVAGLVYRDSNGNGAIDVGEPGLAGVQLTLKSNGVTVAQTTTDAGGRYSFTNAPGTYSLGVATNTLPGGLVLVGVGSGATNNPWVASLPANGLSEVNWGFESSGGGQYGEVSGEVVYEFLKWELNRARGTVVGTLRVSDPGGSGLSYGPPYQLGLKASANFFYPTNFGLGVTALPDGVASIDLSGAMAVAVPQGILSPGQAVVLTNAVEIYSLTRSAPDKSQFELWATRY